MRAKEALIVHPSFSRRQIAKKGDKGESPMNITCN